MAKLLPSTVLARSKLPGMNHTEQMLTLFQRAKAQISPEFLRVRVRMPIQLGLKWHSFDTIPESK